VASERRYTHRCARAENLQSDFLRRCCAPIHHSLIVSVLGFAWVRGRGGSPSR
jgi:hypothetical protein